MDDTRDIALNAASSAAAAHHRLDKMNGSIDRLGDETQRLREDMTGAIAKLTEDFTDANIKQLALVSETRLEVTATKTTVGNALKVLAALAGLASAITAGVSVYTLTHLHRTPASPATVIQPAHR